MEISSTDLRQGNLLLHEVHGVVAVAAIHQSNIYVGIWVYDKVYTDVKRLDWIHVKEFKAIDITQDIVKSFGFKNSGDLTWYFGNIIQVSFLPSGRILDLWLFPITGHPLRYVKYVHQLQNIHYVLKQIELTLKTPISL